MNSKDASLEGLRGVAALGVVLAHILNSFFPYLGIYSAPKLNIPRMYYLEEIAALPYLRVLYNGNFAVSVFFVLSGYVLTKKFFDTGDFKYLRSGAVKRYPRLVIPALGSVLIAWALLETGAMHTFLIPKLGGAGWPAAQYRDDVGFGYAIWQGLIGAPILSETSLNAPLWTIRIELLGSLLLFATYALFGMRRPVLTSMLFLSFTFFVAAGSPVMFHLLAIFSGSLIHYFEIRLRSAKFVPALLIAGGLIGGAFDYSRVFAGLHKLTLPDLPAPFFNLETAEPLIYNSIGAFLLVAGVIGCRPAARVLASRGPAYLGRISFSMYLLHWPIVCSFSYWMMGLLKLNMGLSHWLSAIISTMLSLVLIFVVSDLYERLVDKRAVRLGNRLSDWVWPRAAGNTQGAPVSKPLPQPV